ncbi:hypothetical protein Q2328_25710, partial [Escherichia coli]|nr:hypothetical protein [Escherichia coli]
VFHRRIRCSGSECYPLARVLQAGSGEAATRQHDQNGVCSTARRRCCLPGILEVSLRVTRQAG